jgi:hypothetical protein
VLLWWYAVTAAVRLVTGSSGRVLYEIVKMGEMRNAFKILFTKEKVEINIRDIGEDIREYQVEPSDLKCGNLD